MVISARNLILVENFSTFNMILYRQLGSAYIDWFKQKMKKLFLESRRALAYERVNLDLIFVERALGIGFLEASYMFMDKLVAEACMIQDLEFEEYMKHFLLQVDGDNVWTERPYFIMVTQMETEFTKFAFATAQVALMKQAYIVVPQEIYMSLGRFALLLHTQKWKFDQKHGIKKQKKIDIPKWMRETCELVLEVEEC